MNDVSESSHVPELRADHPAQQLAPAIQIVEIHEDPTFREAMLKVLRGWWVVLLTLLVVLVFVGLWLSTQPVRYEARMVVAPVAQTADASGGLSGLSNLAQIAGISVSGASAPPMFERYTGLLTSVRIAERILRKEDLLKEVFASQWDAEAQSWHPPKTGLIGGALNSLKSLFGVATWSPPGSVSLASYVSGNLEALPVENTRLVMVTFRDTDPEFALRMLRLVSSEAETALREEFREQTNLRLQYLQAQLASTPNVDIRRTLAASTLVFLQQQIHANANLPVAADVVEPPYVTPTPIEPKVMLVLGLGGFGALLLGIGLVFAIDAMRDPRRDIAPVGANWPLTRNGTPV